MPLASVFCGVPVTLPPPVTVKLTGTPGTPLPFASLINTFGAAGTAVPAGAFCKSPANLVICVAASAVPVALNVTDDPMSLVSPVGDPVCVGPVTVAVTVFAPAVVPSVQLVQAMPFTSVCVVPRAILPPPETT